MLIGGDDISNDVMNLSTCMFSFFFLISTRFSFALIGGNLTAQSTGSYRDLFPPRRRSAPGAQLAGYVCNDGNYL